MQTHPHKSILNLVGNTGKYRWNSHCMPVELRTTFNWSSPWWLDLYTGHNLNMLLLYVINKLSPSCSVNRRTGAGRWFTEYYTKMYCMQIMACLSMEKKFITAKCFYCWILLFYSETTFSFFFIWCHYVNISFAFTHFEWDLPTVIPEFLHHILISRFISFYLFIFASNEEGTLYGLRTSTLHHFLQTNVASKTN